ncbi:hypothetical protein CHELA1G11_10861 [Hyphomicrobiales bacterium]|nr:hypothetical protein CHELA1G11_10861 [Hyphomicrobiales bacterium]CAH1671795.1 hypothetical protein CHELA1G2_13448 [Hyphomicrobiales bacterium]
MNGAAQLPVPVDARVVLDASWRAVVAYRYDAVVGMSDYGAYLGAAVLAPRADKLGHAHEAAIPLG